MTNHLYFVHVLSPLHAGTGQGSGVIDLPIAREKATGMPYLPGSSVKGVLRDKSGDNALTNALFGPKTENASDHAGSLHIADARLLLLPVRSLRGTFAWVTSPYMLRRFSRDASDVKLIGLPPIPTLTDASCDVVPDTALKVTLRQSSGTTVDRIVLEDLDLEMKPKYAQLWADWMRSRIFSSADQAWPDLLAKRLCIVSDDIFTFLLSTAIEIIARNRLSEETKTVAKGALWYEEALPAETVLYGLAVLTPTKEIRKTHQQDTELLKHVNTLASGAMQFGGKATVGRGLCRMRLLGEG
jgi:CRISPR-associated protein Cmr4